MKQKLEHRLIDDPAFIDWVVAPTEVSENYWKGWLKENPGRETELKETKLFLQHIHFSDNSAHLNESVLLDRIHLHIESSRTSPRFKLKYLMGIAASIALILTAWFFFPSPSSFQTPYSEIKQINLPDGSFVTLNANSELQILGKWKNGEDRNVHLTGEAYFDVSKSPTQGGTKFNVHTSNGIIKVLGTKFNVKDREDNFSIALDEGKIAFKSPQAEFDLIPGEVILEDENDQISKSFQDTKTFSSWKSMEINLENLTLLEVANVLEEFHAVNVKFENDALKQRLLKSGRVDYSNLEDFLNILQKAYNINFTQEGRTITFAY